MKFQQELLSNAMEEMKPLLALHWREIAHYQDIPLDPDYEAYLAAEDRGRVRVFTARISGDMVGYAVFFIGNMHYKSTKIATQDVLFLLPQYRGGGAGVGLIRFCDKALKSEGTKVVYQHVKRAHDFGPVLMRMGYEPVDTIYGKRLDKE